MELYADLLIRDLVFINYTVDPAILRPFVPAELQLNTIVDERGRAVAFVSVVAFHVSDVRSGILPLPPLSFNQINYRAYVNDGEGPAVYFFEMRVNARVISAMTSFWKMPVNYEEINIATAPVSENINSNEIKSNDINLSPHALRYKVISSGPQALEASLTIGGHHEVAGPRGVAVPPGFITERPVGYVTAASDSLYKISVEHAPLNASAAHVESVSAPLLASLGIMNLDETARPHSALYAREALFKSRLPRPVAQE